MDDADRRQEQAEGGEAAKTQWHPGFRGAFRREFRKYRDCLRFEEEFPLTVSSLFVDLLVIEVLKPVSMENELGKIFRKYNIIEYKGPDDALTVDDYYKTVACACLYKCSGQTVNEIPAREITVSLIRDAYPRKLFQTLEADGFTAAERYPGVFYLDHPGGGSGVGLTFPTQVIVTGRLSRETHSGLRILRRPADREDILRFLTESGQDTEPGDIANANAILSASMAANVDLYGKIKEATDMLYPALQELMKKDLEERWTTGWNVGMKEGAILSAVRIYREEMGLDNGTIMEKIARQYHLTKESAAHYVYHPQEAREASGE